MIGHVSCLEFCRLMLMEDIMAPAGYKNGLSFFTGWMANAGWIALVATASSLGANFVYGVAYLWKEFEPAPYQNFLLYLAFTLWATLLNVFGIHLLPIVDSTAGLWSLVGIVVVIITLLACSSGHYQPAKDVFARWTNTTGWPDGMAFILGLLQSTFGLTGFDAVTHMIEEMPRPSKNAPKVMVIAVILGSTTSFVFMVVILFCLRDWDEVLTSTTGPLLQVYYQATNSKIGGTCLIVFNIGSMLFAAQGLTTVASRMLLSFVRDRGLGKLSRPLEPVHPKLKVPVWCILFVSGWVGCFGLIELGSSVALNAILSASLVFLQISYFVPIFLLLIRGDRAFNNYNNDAVWSLGKWRRPINAMALIFITVTTVVFLFPPFIPVTSASQMNFVVVVFGIVMVMCLATWLIDGRKHFNGPSDLNMRLAMGKEA